MVVEHALHQSLAIIEIAFDRERMDIAGARRRHLLLLNRRDAPVRKKDEDVSAFAACKGLDCRAAGVT